MKRIQRCIALCSIGLLSVGATALADVTSNTTSTQKGGAMEEKAKRRAPKPVKAVEINKIRYEIAGRLKTRAFGQDGGVITAIDTATGAELWTIAVYQTLYDPKEERDVQEVYITSMTPSGDQKSLIVENEAHKSYFVNLATQEVSEITGK
jgi:hypothetical protein